MTAKWMVAGVVGLIIIAIGVFIYYLATGFDSGSESEVKTPKTNQVDGGQEASTDQPETDQPPDSSQPKLQLVYTDNHRLLVSQFMTNLEIPWDISFTPDGAALVVERGGKLIARLADGTLQTVEADFSDLDVRHELGLMGMVVDPNFANNRRFYTCQGDRIKQQIKVVAWRMGDDYSVAERVDDPLVGDIPSANIHDGCRLRFGGEGYLWISTGDAATGSHPQDINSLAGKILRVDSRNGRPAANNPFDDSDSAKLIYSFGHRNPQGLAYRLDSDQMWVVEHGPDINDEINLLVKGGNYGWDPVSASNSYYQQVPMTNKEKYPQATEAKWSSGDSTLATSGGIFLEGDWWGEKEGWLAVATLKDNNLYLFDFDKEGTFKSSYKVAELSGNYGRLRSVLIGPDQALYVTTSNGGGKDFVLRVAPDLSD